jgi:hypothetical protein
MAFEVNSVPLSPDDHAWAAPADLAEFTHHTWRSERGVDDQTQAFPGEVIDQGQDTEAPAADQRVHHEVEQSSDQRRF